MRQMFINIVGLPASGKRTLAQQISKAMRELNIVDGDPIRRLLNEQIVYYHDPGTVGSGPVNDSFAHIVDSWRVELMRELLKQKQSVLVVGGIDPASRGKYQKVVRQEFSGVPIIMIHAQVDEAELLKRLESRGPKAVEWYKTYAKTAIKPPAEGEYDELILYDQTNAEEIIHHLNSKF